MVHLRYRAYFNPEIILKSARELDAIPAEKRGPLHGVAVGVKDVILTKDMPTQHFSPIYKDDHPVIDAGPVMTLRAAGALIFGKVRSCLAVGQSAAEPSADTHDGIRDVLEKSLKAWTIALLTCDLLAAVRRALRPATLMIPQEPLGVAPPALAL